MGTKQICLRKSARVCNLQISDIKNIFVSTHTRFTMSTTNQNIIISDRHVRNISKKHTQLLGKHRRFSQET